MASQVGFSLQNSLFSLVFAISQSSLGKAEREVRSIFLFCRMDELVQLGADAAGGTRLWSQDGRRVFYRFTHVEKLLRPARFRAAHWAQETTPSHDYVTLAHRGH